MKQELQYLRDELNQRGNVQYEHASKTINTVLIIWGGVLIFFGNGGIKFTEISLENIPLYFIMATIFFISNLILYYTARKYYNNTDGIFALSAYITVFYEKRPSKNTKNSENSSWELAIFENMDCNTDKKTKHKKHIHKRNVEYAALAAVSTALILIILMVLCIHIINGLRQIWSVILFLIDVIYFVVSLCWICKISKYTFLKDNYKMRSRHLKKFIKYAIDTGYYSEEEARERFGDYIYNVVMKDDNVTVEGMKNQIKEKKAH